MTTTGSMIYVRLVSMRDKAGNKLFQRLGLAKRLLADRVWVESRQDGGG